jgi:glycosyltransferase involved in cell wall biosynthesis
MGSLVSPKPCSLSIGFDNQIFRRQARGGISRYFRELAVELSTAGLDVRRAMTEQRRPWPSSQPWRQADVVHATFYAGQPYRRRSHQNLVSSLFDMTPERHPEHFFLPSLRSPHANKARWLEASDLILSISAASADDLAFFQPKLRVPLKVIHLATAIDRLIPQPITRLNGRRFWLMVGKRHAYKNGLTVLRALALLQKKNARKSHRCEQPLMIYAGGGPWRPDERRWITSQRLEETILQLAANDRELAWLYRHAEAVLVPSLAEGFSLPLIEALACDAPIIASDLEVHREVGKGYATFLPALNANAWAEQLNDGGQLEKPSKILGAAGYRKLRNYYAPNRLIQEHIAAYSATAGLKRPD